MPFFLNIVVQDKHVAVRRGLEEMEGAVVKNVPFVTIMAANLVSDNQFGALLAEKVIEAVPAALSEFGITAKMETKYQQGAIVVLKFTVVTVDMSIMLEAATCAPAGSSEVSREAAAVKLQALHRGNMARKEAREKREALASPSYWESLRSAVVSPIQWAGGHDLSRTFC